MQYIRCCDVPGPGYETIRAGHRGSVTRTLAQLQGSLEAEERSTSKLSLALRTLREKLAIIRALDAEILDATVSEQDVCSEIEEADILREKIELAISEIESALSVTSETSVPTQNGASGSGHDVSRSDHDVTESRQSVTVTEQANPSQNFTVVVSEVETPPATSSSTLAGTRSTRETRIRLPKLELRQFNGELTSWMAFWDSFEAAIHNNHELSSVDKFNYLNTLLEDSAAAAVAGLTLTSANYGEAVEILKKRFGNKQMIIAKHMDTLMNLEAVSSQHNLKGLRHLYNLVESHTRGLGSLGVPSSSYGTLLSSVLINKLPQEFRLTISREIKEGEWDLSAVMKILDRDRR